MSHDDQVKSLATFLGQLIKERAPEGYARVYVTDDWDTDPVNPANGGSLETGVLVFKRN